VNDALIWALTPCVPLEMSSGEMGFFFSLM